MTTDGFTFWKGPLLCLCKVCLKKISEHNKMLICSRNLHADSPQIKVYKYYSIIWSRQNAK